jgi:hypothetical protein
MTIYEYDLPLPHKQKELLMRLAKESEQRDLLSVEYVIQKHNKPPYNLSFIIREEEIKVDLFEDPVPGFEVLGLVKRTDEHTLFLTPKLFKWADYEQKNQFMKWVARNPNLARDALLAISILLSITLILLRFFQK